MSTFTENYNLIKPSEEDYYDVQDFNENMDSIDAQLAETEGEVAGIQGKIGSYGDTAPETIFGQFHRMSGNVSTVKSIHHHIYCNVDSTSFCHIPLGSVNPERCVVFWQHLKYAPDWLEFSYTVETDNLHVTHPSYAADDVMKVDFWVIEFY